MGRKIARATIVLAGALSAYSLVSALLPFAGQLSGQEFTGLLAVSVNVMGALLGGLIFFFISPWLMGICLRLADIAENYVQRIPVRDMVMGAVGLTVGLIVATLLSRPLDIIPLVGGYLKIAAYVLLGYLGLRIAVTKSDEIAALLLPGQRRSATVSSEGGIPKVLDTSVIIDGRILDIVRTGFLEGTLFVPSFVLEELRHIADSADVLRRNRGRRGLDVLNSIQKESGAKVEIIRQDYDDQSEVDSKLVRLAQDLKAKIITNDYNLNKVCEVQGVSVLNINELANALKPVVLPGEEMSIQVMREGKEFGQGVAYLDDGTMIVVEQGRKHIGDTIAVIVTSVLQTSAGRMIFAKLR
ncbi:MAG: putative PIN and TRAM-domain containing protein YacL [Firmicutes bacterium]|nr:putative PIN and TRAM-domain containing protein YacL [candidate division NPL-UPA2 bacterium]